jgi:hypothetical protein
MKIDLLIPILSPITIFEKRNYGIFYPPPKQVGKKVKIGGALNELTSQNLIRIRAQCAWVCD